MSERFRLFIAYTSICVSVDAFFSLFYFWSALRSYSLLILGSSLTFPMGIAYGQAHWHGPDAFMLVILGMLSPLVTFLPYALLSPWLKKWRVWMKACIVLLWLAEIMA